MGAPKLPSGTVLDIGHPLLGSYLTTGILGKGAQGVVYQVENRRKQRFAAKVAASEATAQERLRRESQALAKVRSAHVVEFVEAGADPMVGWVLVQSLVPGAPLSKIRPGPPFWTLSRVVELGIQVAEGLQAIGQAGLVMRDLSPAQVMVAQSTSGLFVCLVDLGLARGEGKPSDLTDPRLIAGTPGFTAPEWVLQGVGSAASDVYSLAAILWWTLLGRNPFGSASPELSLGLQLSGWQPKVSSESLKGIAKGPEVAALLERSLSMNPAARPSSPAVFAEVLRTLV